MEKALAALLGFTTMHGWKTKTVSSDHERAFESVELFLREKAVELRLTPPGRHERRLERKWQALKNKSRAIVASLPFRLPAKLAPLLIEHVVDVTNASPSLASGDSSPYVLFMRRRPAWSALRDPSANWPFSRLRMRQKDSSPRRTTESSWDGIEHTRNTFKVFKITSQTIVVRHQGIPVEPTESIIKIINDLSEADEPLGLPTKWSLSRMGTNQHH